MFEPSKDVKIDLEEIIKVYGRQTQLTRTSGSLAGLLNSLNEIQALEIIGKGTIGNPEYRIRIHELLKSMADSQVMLWQLMILLDDLEGVDVHSSLKVQIDKKLNTIRKRANLEGIFG